MDIKNITEWICNTICGKTKTLTIRPISIQPNIRCVVEDVMGDFGIKPDNPLYKHALSFSMDYIGNNDINDNNTWGRLPKEIKDFVLKKQSEQTEQTEQTE